MQCTYVSKRCNCIVWHCPVYVCMRWWSTVVANIIYKWPSGCCQTHIYICTLWQRPVVAFASHKDLALARSVVVRIEEYGHNRQSEYLSTQHNLLSSNERARTTPRRNLRAVYWWRRRLINELGHKLFLFYFIAQHSRSNAKTQWYTCCPMLLV